jgi:DNA-binding GntR family transcriptional regulator
MTMPPTQADALSRPAGRGLVRVNTSDMVAERILEMLVAGELRPGDRIDLDAMAAELGVSRAPVREALLVLRRDGIIEMPFHRGAFVARFDATTIREAFELYALLHALTTARLARQRPADVLTELAAAAERAGGARDAIEFESASREFRRIINVAAGGPHLRALLRSFNGLVPVASRLAIDGRLGEERRLVAAENEAIQAGEVERARALTIRHMRELGDRAAAVLRADGVIDDEAPAESDPDLELLLAALDGEGDR